MIPIVSKYICICTCICICIYICMRVCVHVCMHACIYVCMHVCMYVCMHACMHVCMHVWTIHVNIDVFVYVYRNTNTRTHTTMTVLLPQVLISLRLRASKAPNLALWPILKWARPLLRMGLGSHFTLRWDLVWFALLKLNHNALRMTSM